MRSLNLFTETRIVSDIDSALKWILLNRRSLDSSALKLFFFSGLSYMRTLTALKRIKICCPSSKFMFLDETHRRGAECVVHRGPIHGYMTGMDSWGHCRDCIVRVVREGAACSTTSCDKFRIDFQRRELVCSDRIREDSLHRLSQTEWTFFHGLLSGRNPAEEADRILSRLGFESLLDLIREAQRWGLLES